jgi:hypothetical protein
MPMSRLSHAVATGHLAILGSLPLTLRRRYIYLLTHGQLPHLARPRTFSEKLTWRIIHDRRADLTWTCDKVEMKRHVSALLGDAVRVPRTLWAGAELAELNTLALPRHWVLKPTHRSGLVYFGSGTPDLEDIERRTVGWLQERNWSLMGEWAYKFAQPQFLVEEHIGAAEEDLPDYKFFVFDGQVQIICVHTDRFSAPHLRVYDEQWNPIQVTDGLPLAPVTAPPANFDAMKDIAQRIAAGFDFLRVDLYTADNEVWFGETTPYPASATTVWSPHSFDQHLGDLWQLPSAAAAKGSAA